MDFTPGKISLQKISDAVCKEAEVNLQVLRLDQTHVHISGNKWFKLKYNLEELVNQKKDTILTYGGAYSNHIAATAAAGKEYGFKTIGIIRGKELEEELFSLNRLNSTLSFARDCGMQLNFISRAAYRQLRNNPYRLEDEFPEAFILPEGGANDLSIKGCAEITSYINIPFDYICSASGTGGTISGIISSLRGNQKAIGFSVLKTKGYHEREVKRYLSSVQVPAPLNWEVNEEYHFGGYAKYNTELLKFIDAIEHTHHIPLDQVYTGKMLYGVYDLIRKGYFPKGSTIVAVHTGGLQGKLT